MNHVKIAIPRMERITKATSGLGKILISLTVILTHGHGDGAYAYYNGLLSNSPRRYFEHHLRTHSSTYLCMESLNAPLQSQIQRVVTMYHLLPWDAQLFHFQRGSTFSSKTPRRTTRTYLSCPFDRCLLPGVFSRRSP
jgi:hypothetical protein